MKVRLASGSNPTYTHTGTAIAFIISKLPGERAEASSLRPTAGEQFTNRPGLRLRIVRIMSGSTSGGPGPNCEIDVMGQVRTSRPLAQAGETV